MELKASVASVCNYNLRGRNPFNGIERVLILAILLVSRWVLNSFDGIERAGQTEVGVDTGRGDPEFIRWN